MSSCVSKKLFRFILSLVLILGLCPSLNVQIFANGASSDEKQCRQLEEFVADSSSQNEVTSDLDSNNESRDLSYQNQNLSFGIFDIENAIEHLLSNAQSISNDKSTSEDDQVTQEANVNTSFTGNGTIKVAVVGGEEKERIHANAGDVVNVIATPDDDSYLSQVRYSIKKNPSDDFTTYTTLSESDDSTFSFSMPEGEVEVCADFVTKVWDGTIDVSWYDPIKTEYHLNYAAQFEGAAAINNGIFTLYPTQTVTPSSSTDSHEVPDYEKYLEGIGAVKDADGNLIGSKLYGEFSGKYTLYDSQGKDKVNDYAETEPIQKTQVFIGNPAYVTANNSIGSTGKYNLVTSNTYWYGSEDWDNKKIYIDSDLDFGATKTDDGTWSTSSPLFMSLGGQYSMLPQNGYSVLGSSFNGTLDGLGHKFKNVYAERFAKGNNYGDSQTLGIVGRLGNHDNDSSELATLNPTVRQIIFESGYMSARRSSGCIVGKIGQTSASKLNDGSTGGIIEYCINKADIVTTDSKGVGGICGAGWNKGVIRYCANFGTVKSVYASGNPGGIVGTCEVPVIGCYNVGKVYGTVGRGITKAEAIGSNNGGATWTDCFYLKGSDEGSSTPGVYSGTSKNVHSFGLGGDYEVLQAWMVNGGSSVSEDGPRVWKDDTIGINAKESVNYPVLYYQSGDVTSKKFNVYALQNTTYGKVVVDKTEAKYGDVVNLSNELLNPGYVFDSYLVNGEKIDGSSFVVTKDSMVIATYKKRSEITLTIEDTSEKDYEITVKKDGIVYVDGLATNVSNHVVKNGDSVYEGDVLTYEAKIKEGATPEDVNKEYSGQVSFKTACADKQVGSSSTYTVTGSNATELNVSVSKAYEVYKSWMTKADTSWYDAKKTEFFISTPEQLEGIAKLVNECKYDSVSKELIAGANFEGKTIKLAGDISLKNNDGTDGIRQWGPIASGGSSYSGTVFMGTFDGCNHQIIDLVAKDSISGVVSSCRGLFGIIKSAVVKNVSVTGEVATSSSTGGIVGKAESSTIENCTSNVVISASTSYGNIGGIVGDASSVNVKDCVNNRDVTGYISYSYLGGIVGQALTVSGTNPEVNFSVSGCINNGAIKTAEDKVNNGRNVGGIVGYCNKYIDIKECTNNGEVSATSTSTSSSVTVGGVVGNMTGGNIVSECANTGSVTNATNGDVGGLVGNMNSGGTITDSFNQGNVKTINSSGKAGGFIGNCSGTSSGSVTNSYTSGVVSSLAEGNFAAISPDAYRKPIVTNCYYLDTTGTTGGTNTDDTYDGVIAKSSSDLVNANLLLGDKFIKDSKGGYPILGFQNFVKVNFDTNGGTDVEFQYVEVGNSVGEPESPKKEGLTFAGWYSDSKLKNPYIFDDMIFEEKTLYAKWMSGFYFETNGAISEVPSQTVEEGGRATKPSFEPIKENLKFAGWYSDSDLTNVFNFDTTKINSNTTVYAKWTATVLFDTNGASSDVKSQTVKEGDKVTLPDVNPTKTDLTFAGWYSDSDLTNEFNFDTTTIDKNTTVYAKWTATVSFDTNGATFDVISQTVKEGDKALKPDVNPTKTDLTFAGWYSDSDLTNEFYFDTTAINKNTTLYAKWMAAFLFEVNGGSDVARQVLNVGDCASRPKVDPTKPNLTFAGWYSDKDMTNEYNFNSTVNINTTIYAKWNATLTFNTKGGSEVSSQAVKEGDVAIKSVDDPVKDGFIFGGWYTDETCREEFDFSSPVRINTMLFAKWNVLVWFDTNGGSDVASQLVKDGDKVAKPQVNPSKDALEFDGWYSDRNCEIKYDFESAVNKTTTIYSKWVAKVNFETGEGSKIESQTVKEGQKAVKPSSNPTREGFSFAGWYSTNDCTTEFDFASAINKDTTIYANWVSATTFNVEFNTNGGGEIDPQTVVVGKTAEEPKTDPVKDGFVFGGWYSDEDLTTAYDFTSSVNRQTTIYAKWNVVVIFDTDSGTQIQSQTIKAGDVVIKPVVEPVKQGVTFAGWYSDRNCDVAFDFNSKINKFMTLYARWDAVVTFDTDGGSSIDEQNVKAGFIASKPAKDPKKSGYKFLGWFADKDCKTVFDFTKPVSSNITVYAKYQRLVSVSFNTGTTDVLSIQQISVGEVVTKPADPTKEGYRFLGWYADSDYKTAFDFTKPITTDTIIYAKWTDRIGMYRLYNKYSGEHFYTNKDKEKESLVKAGWQYEGYGWYAPISSNKPVYRVYNPNSGDHHYTLDKNEYETLGKAGWTKEGVGWYSADKTTPSAVAILRQYNPYATAGSHNFTIKVEEKNGLVKAGWKDEGEAWWGFASE